MTIKYQRIASIPKGAWCAVTTFGEAVAKVYVGTAVETNPDYFVQGVWNGEFKKGNFIGSNFSCCTGGVVNKCERGGVIFSTPTHMLESLYGIRKYDQFYISNSLAFLLVKADEELDTNYPDYQLDMCSSIFGIDNQVKSSPLASGNRLFYYRCCNVEIDESLNISVQTKDSGLAFANYKEYFYVIKSIMKGLFENATSVDRKIRYGSISTISQGYDAVATSVLGHMFGCDSVITFNRPSPYDADCGTEIARKIGYKNIYECDATQYKYQNEFVEAECISSGDVGSAIIFAAHKKFFKNSMILMGIRGDSLWERNHGNVNNRQDFTDGNTLQQTDHTFVETCLQTNSVVIPVPMIGADRWKDLALISQSEEMKPYSIRETYDRPIPRRIAVEYGVPRNWFGNIKSGAGISYHFDTFGRVLDKMSPTSASDLKNYRHQFKMNSVLKFKQYYKFYLNEMPVYMNYLLSRMHINARIKRQKKFISSPLSSILIHWSIDKMKLRYK